MKPVYLASPYRGDVTRNRAYLEAAIRDCLARGEAPFAPHAYLPAVLNDANPRDRAKGLEVGLAWLKSASALVAYIDYGWTDGMKTEKLFAEQYGAHIEERRLAGWSP